MKKREPKLRLYTALLHLYPASFRQKYEEQLLLTAADILINKRSTGAVALANLRLCFDTVGSALRVRATLAHTLEPRLRGTTPRSAFRSFLFAIWLVLVSVISLLWFMQLNFAINSIISYMHSADMTVVTVISESLVILSMLAHLPLAILLVSRHAKLSLWKTISWGYALGVAGTIGAGLFGFVVYKVFIPTSSASDLLILSVYAALFFMAVTRIAKRLARPQLPIIS